MAMKCLAIFSALLIFGCSATKSNGNQEEPDAGAQEEYQEEDGGQSEADDGGSGTDTGFDAGPADEGVYEEPDAGADDGGEVDAGPGDQEDAGVPDGTADGAGDDFPDVVPDDCITDVTPGVHTFECGDLSFTVAIPELCLSAPCGLVVDAHGATMNAQMEDNNTNMRELGNQAGYLVVQPQAPGGVFSGWGPEDAAPVVDFIQRCMDVFHLDPDRIHMMGFSAGANLTLAIVCNFPDLIASVSFGGTGKRNVEGEISCLTGGTGNCEFDDNSAPTYQFDILFMQGVEDGFVNFVCAEALVEAIATLWSMDGPTFLEGDQDYEMNLYTNTQGTELKFVQHNYLADSLLLKGHCYPGSDDYEPQEPGQLMGFACLGDCAFHFGQISIEWFLAHPKN